MTGEVLSWPIQQPSNGQRCGEEFSLEIKFKLDGILALVRAIEGGELLAAFPEDQTEQIHFRTTLSLLALAEKEILEVGQFIDAARV